MYFRILTSFIASVAIACGAVGTGFDCYARSHRKAKATKQYVKKSKKRQAKPIISQREAVIATEHAKPYKKQPVLAPDTSKVFQHEPIIVPAPLKPGSTIALITPASSIESKTIDTAIQKIHAMGYKSRVLPHAYGHNYGSYAASDEDRAADLMAAFADPDVDAIMCTRGGYGTVRLLPMLDIEVIRANPKWLIGYSDISDLHALMRKAGVASIHGPMNGHLASEPDSLDATVHLWTLLAEGLPLQYDEPAHPYNKYGRGAGRLVGGNLLTINGLSETPYDVMNPADGEDIILFIEDVSEQIYAIERVLMRMHLNGSLSKLKGLIIGQFTDYKPSSDFASMENMIHYWLRTWGYYDEDNPLPIVFGFPTGHVSRNFPMVVNAMARLTVTPEGTTLRLTDD